MNIVIVGINVFAKYNLAPALLKSYCLKDPLIKKNTRIILKWFSIFTQNNNVLKEIMIERPTIVAFSCYIWNINKILNISSAIKKSGFKGSIILGGPEVSFIAQQILFENPSVDIIVQGEGEVTFSDIVRHFLSRQKGFDDIPGIVLRKGHDIVENNPRPLMNNLEEIPSPYLNGVVDLNTIGSNLCAFETYRGCAFRCDYCLWGGNNARRIRYFSLDRIEKELRAIMESNIKRVWYADSISNFNRERFKKILRIILRNNYKKLTFDFEMQAELLDEETIDLLSKIQVGYIAFGLQSSNRLVLKKINRKWNKKLFEQNINLLQKKAKNIDVRIDLLYGLPGDTFKSYKKSFDYAMSFHPRNIQTHRLQVLPGSPMYNNALYYGIGFMRKAPHYFLGSNTFSVEDCNKAKMYGFVYNNRLIKITINQLSKCLNIQNSKLFEKLLKHLNLNKRVNIRNIVSKITLELLNSFIKINLSRSRATSKAIPPFIELIRYLYIITQTVEKTTEEIGNSKIKNTFHDLSIRRDNIYIEKFQYNIKDFASRRLFDRDAKIKDIEKKTIFLVRDIRVPGQFKIYDSP